MRRVHVIVRGDVQNVGFRSWTRHKAGHFGISGWVRNNDDGTVEAIFEGLDHNVEEIIEECRRGPPGSYVEKVETDEEKFVGDFRGFEIRI